MAIRVGTSGWSYAHWEPELYPPGLPAAGRLDRYAATFSTAELNSSFYRWPRPEMFRHWRHKLPEGFSLSVKAPRGLTHGRKLYGPETWLQRMGAGWHELGGKRAVLLASSARPSRAMMRGWPISCGWCRNGCGSRSSCAIPAGIATKSLPCWRRTARRIA